MYVNSKRTCSVLVNSFLVMSVYNRESSRDEVCVVFDCVYSCGYGLCRELGMGSAATSHCTGIPYRP